MPARRDRLSCPNRRSGLSRLFPRVRDLLRRRRRAARYPKPAAGSQASFHRLRLVIAGSLDQFVVRIHERGDQDLSFRRIGIPTGTSEHAATGTTAEQAEIKVLRTTLLPPQLNSRA